MYSIYVASQWGSCGFKTTASPFVYLIASFNTAYIQVNVCVKHFTFIFYELFSRDVTK